MKPAILKEIGQIRRQYPGLRQKHGAGMAKELLADRFGCSIERIRQIVVLKTRPYEDRYQRTQKRS